MKNKTAPSLRLAIARRLVGSAYAAASAKE